MTSYEPLSEEHVRVLLATAMAYDNRNPGEANIAAWLEAAHRGRWTFSAAQEAVHDHYATSTEFLMPGHITARVRQQYRQPAAHLALPPASPASQETRERMKAMIGERFALPRDVPRGRQPERKSADHAAAVEAARAELDALRERLTEESS